MKQTSNLLYVGQLMFMLVSIYAFVIGSWIVGLFLLYMSFNFFRLKVTLGRQISKDFKDKADESLKTYTNLGRKGRRMFKRNIKVKYK